MAEDNSNIFEHIADNMPGLVFQMRFRKDGSWYWNYLSPSGLKMLGLEEDFVTNDSILKGHAETDWQKLMDSIRKSVKNLTDWEYEIEFTKSDTTKIWLNCTGKTYVVDDEISLSGIILDISEKKKTQIRLNESEALYKSLFNNATDSIMLMEGEKIVRCNKRTLDFFGCKSESEIIGKTPLDFSPEYQQGGELSKEIAARRISSALKGESQSFEWVHSRKNGEEFSAEINLSVMELNSKHYILALVRDISQRRRIQNELIDLQEYLQLQIERMPIALMVMDTEFRIKSWNPSSERIFGFPESYALGKHPYEFIVPEDIQMDTTVIFERLMNGDDSANLVNKNLTRDGRIITCKWSNTPLKKSDGTVVGILSMAEDVTEQKRAEEELKTYQNYLEELVRERTIELEVTAERLDEREKLVRLLSEISSASNLSDNPEDSNIFCNKKNFRVYRMALRAYDLC